jgi:hypothetical protein
MPDNPEDEQVPEQDDLATLRKQAKDGKKALVENAFLRAGVDTAKGAGKIAFEKFEGDANPDAVNAFVAQVTEEYGFPTETAETPPPEEKEEPEVDPAVQQQRAEQAQIREEMAAPGSEVDPGQVPDRHPGVEGFEAFKEARAAGVPTDDAAQEYFGRIFDAAVKGDERVLYVPNS